MSEKTTMERIAAFWRCAQAGKHDFADGDFCVICEAHKGDATLLDVLRHAKVKKENPYAQ